MKTVLIIDEEEAAARQVAEVCAGMGLRAEVLHSGQEVLERAARGAPDLAVATLGGTRVDGLLIGRELRSRSAGLPLLFLSGNAATVPREFANAQVLKKPLQKAALQATIAALLGTHAPARAAGHGEEARQGSLADTPGGAVLVELLRAKATGTLEVTTGQVRRRLYFQGGQLRYGASNLRSENVGGMQVAARTLSEEKFQAAVALAREKRIQLFEALVQSGVMPERSVQEALKLQTYQVAIAVAGERSGTYAFTPGPVGSTPEARQPVVLVALEGLKRAVDAAGARSALAAYAAEPLGRSPELERELFVIRNAHPGEAVTPLCNGRTTVGEALSRLKEPDQVLLYALCMSGLAQVGGSRPAAAPPPAQTHAPPSPAGPDAQGTGPAPAFADESEDAGIQFRPEERDARRRIFSERRRIHDATHYQVLGVDPKASADEIKRAYLLLAKQWHTDAFSGLNLGSAARAQSEIFARVGEAYTTLSDPDKRAEYDIYLDRKAKGLPTDVAAILRAEAIFTQGQMLYRRGKYAEAEAAFREATTLNHAEAEFWAWLGMSIYRVQGDAGLREAREAVDKALSMQANLASALAFAGALARAEGDLPRAEKLLKQALEKEPKNPEAEAEMRLLQQAKSGGKDKGGKGLFSKLFGK